jgi:hypothetical protein
MIPSKITQSLYSDVGKTAQIMPSWIRAVCRSRLDYDEDELLEHMKEKDIEILEASKFKGKFNFVDKHISILSVASPRGVRKFVRSRQHQSAKQFSFCRYEADGNKRDCWSCPRVREIIDNLGDFKDGKESLF